MALRIPSTSNLVSFEEVVRTNLLIQFLQFLDSTLLGVYIVEKYDTMPKLYVYEIDIKQILSFYKSPYVICKFNGF